MSNSEELARGLEQITACLEMCHKQNQKQHEFNTMVVKTFAKMEQELELMKVTLGELSKEVRACRA
jgi:wyosine [tRNA(Phe)-imidazoG37] synthetase (radical SAM superfamily)